MIGILLIIKGVTIEWSRLRRVDAIRNFANNIFITIQVYTYRL